jgi:hypothetical protein
MVEHSDGLYLITTSTYGAILLRLITAPTASEAKRVARIVEPCGQILSVEPTLVPKLKKFTILVNYQGCPSECKICSARRSLMSYVTVPVLARDEEAAIAVLRATECPYRQYSVQKVLCSDQRKGDQS